MCLEANRNHRHGDATGLLQEVIGVLSGAPTRHAHAPALTLSAVTPILLPMETTSEAQAALRVVKEMRKEAEVWLTVPETETSRVRDVAEYWLDVMKSVEDGTDWEGRAERLKERLFAVRVEAHREFIAALQAHGIELPRDLEKELERVAKYEHSLVARHLRAVD